MGVTQMTASGASLLPKACSAPSQTARVLPEPVVAWSKPEWPAFISFQTVFWKGKAFQPLLSSQAMVGLGIRRCGLNGQAHAGSPARRRGNFLLRGQKKVTKEEALNRTRARRREQRRAKTLT